MRRSDKTLSILVALSIHGCNLAMAAPAEVISLADIQPNNCPDPYKISPDGKTCVEDKAKLDAIKFAPDCTQSLGLDWAESTKTCTFVKGKAPSPNCGNKLPALAVKDGKCVVQRDTPRSSLSNYLGDCFKILAEPSPNPLGLSIDDRLVVMWEQEDGKDKTLTVAKGTRTLFGMPMPYFCEPAGRQFSIRSSEIDAIGASRMGWTYGVLTLPFRYYRNDRTFSSGLTLGPYIGRRAGTAGSAVTFAVSAGLGSVKGEVKDTSGNITGTPDLSAIYFAAGWMWDISKSPNLKPFKAGLFFGQDRVSKDNAVTYKNNGKTWLAFQIGFDFTE